MRFEKYVKKQTQWVVWRNCRLQLPNYMIETSGLNAPDCSCFIEILVLFTHKAEQKLKINLRQDDNFFSFLVRY